MLRVGTDELGDRSNLVSKDTKHANEPTPQTCLLKVNLHGKIQKSKAVPKYFECRQKSCETTTQRNCRKPTLSAENPRKE